MPCITLERTTDETRTIHHHPTATELTLVRYQYPHDSDTWLYIGDGSRSHGLDITLESARRLMRVLARYVEDGGWTAGCFSDSACFVLQAAFFRPRNSLSASSGVRYPRAE